jgi:hypothetical protein
MKHKNHATTDNTHSSEVLMTRDNDPLSVFMDEDAIFLDHRDRVIEAMWDAKVQTYRHPCLIIVSHSISQPRQDERR